MGKYVAALFINNRAVTGLNHGDAFSKLSCKEQDGQIESGFVDPQTGKFFTEEIKVYLKQVYLIRHGDATGQNKKSALTELGVLQSYSLANLLDQKDISEFEFFSSPYLRCQQTANVIEEKTGLKFCAKEFARKQDSSETVSHFSERITSMIEELPEKSIIVTHTDVIIHTINQMVGTIIQKVPHCSVSYVNIKELIIIQS